MHHYLFVEALSSSCFHLVQRSQCKRWFMISQLGGTQLQGRNNYRWFLFITVLLSYFLVVIQRTAPGLITETIMKEFQLSASTIGFLSSLQFIAYAALQIPVGLLTDRFGPNRFLVFGVLINGLGTVLFSTAGNAQVLFASRFLVGIGDSMIFVNFIAIISQWFEANTFIKLLGTISIGGGLGSLFASFPFALWLAITGWRHAFLISGLLLLLLAGLSYVVLIVLPQKNHGKPIKPTVTVQLMPKSTWHILADLLRSRQAWATFMGHFGLVGTYISFIGSWGIPYAMVAFHLSQAGASQWVMIGLIGALGGGQISSWLASRRFTARTLYRGMHWLVFVAWVSLFLSGTHPSFALTIVLLLVIGFGNGASALTFAVVRQSFSLEKVGVASGFANTGGFLSAVLLPSLFGAILGEFSSHVTAIGLHDGLLIPVLFSAIGILGSSMLQIPTPNK